MEAIPGLVSITIPFHNAERFLGEAIESVLAQTYQHWELLLADDGSTDRSSEIARDFSAKLPGRVFCLEHPGRRNLGVNAARNLGARNGRGEFLAFLDSDDLWLPEKLEANIRSMTQNPEAGFLFNYTQYWYEWDPEGNHHQKNVIPLLVPGGWLYLPPALFAKSYPLGPFGAPCPCSFLVRRWAFEQVGGFDERFSPATYQIYEDIAFLSKMYLHIPIYVSQECLDTNRCNRFSMTRQRGSLWKAEEGRRFYFRWLKGYLRQHAITDPSIWRAVRKRSWYYGLPLPVVFFRCVARRLSRLRFQ